MEALLTSFVAALLAEWGDRTQLLVIALAARYGKVGSVLAGVAVAALANSLIAAAGGIFVNDLITIRAMSLLVAVALILAGIGGFISRKAPPMGDWKAGAFLTTAVSFFVLEFGDKTQFLTFALAGRFDSLALAAAGATAGIVAASVPAILLGERLTSVLPLKAIRIAIACLFLLAGCVAAISALRLV